MLEGEMRSASSCGVCEERTQPGPADPPTLSADLGMHACNNSPKQRKGLSNLSPAKGQNQALQTLQL